MTTTSASPPLKRGSQQSLEEIYYVKGLERALQDFKAKVLKVIENHTFLATPKPIVVATREVVIGS